MAPLSDLQCAFASALLDADLDVPPPLTSYSSPVPRERFNIYRNNVHTSLIEVLGARYPAVARLVGAEFFSAMARVFIDRSPPTSPVMLEYGGAFAEFLEAFEPVANLAYLPDIARLEWHYHQAYHAADAVALDATALGTVAPEHIASVVFRLHPSLALVRSDYPVFSIWRTNIHDETVATVRSDQGGEIALVLRPALDVEVHRIDLGLATLIGEIANGAALGPAAGRAATADETFAFETALAYLIEAGGIVEYDLEGQPES